MRKIVVGIFHHSPEEYLSIIQEGIPEADLRVCTRWDGISEIIADVEALLAFKFGFRPFPRDEILAELDRLVILVDNTGGQQEHRAFAFLRTYVEQAGESPDVRERVAP